MGLCLGPGDQPWGRQREAVGGERCALLCRAKRRLGGSAKGQRASKAADWRCGRRWPANRRSPLPGGSTGTQDHFVSNTLLQCGWPQVVKRDGMGIINHGLNSTSDNREGDGDWRESCVGIVEQRERERERERETHLRQPSSGTSTPPTLKN